MARYQIIVSYDGSHFLGSQRQANSRTVQGVLESALSKLGWMGKSIVLAGRTDTGVHATGQVAAFDLAWLHTSEDLQKALNANLPLDVAISAVQTVSPVFNPRFDATSRRYLYRLFCQPVRDPLRERFSWRVPVKLDGDRLFQVSQILLGEHDFAAFGSPPRAGGSTVRTVLHSFWKQEEDQWTFEVQANAFLYRMVRRLVNVQVAVGQGKVNVDVIHQALQGRDELPAGLAPAHGLTLVEVTY